MARTVGETPAAVRQGATAAAASPAGVLQRDNHELLQAAEDQPATSELLPRQGDALRAGAACGKTSNVLGLSVDVVAAMRSSVPEGCSAGAPLPSMPSWPGGTARRGARAAGYIADARRSEVSPAIFAMSRDGLLPGGT